MNLPQKKIEKKMFKNGYKNIIALDEVGIGSLAGPVVTCAILFEKKFFDRRYSKLIGLKESKLLSSRQREKYAGEIKKIGLKYSITYTYPITIDRINIHTASKKAMARAVKNIDKVPNAMVLVDGKIKIEGILNDQLSIIKGDRDVFSIACASILAKVYRDNMMLKYSRRFPGYGFEKHKGYGTKLHIMRLKSLGPCEIHRKSFAPVAKLT